MNFLVAKVVCVYCEMGVFSLWYLKGSKAVGPPGPQRTSVLAECPEKGTDLHLQFSAARASAYLSAGFREAVKEAMSV